MGSRGRWHKRNFFIYIYIYIYIKIDKSLKGFEFVIFGFYFIYSLFTHALDLMVFFKRFIMAWVVFALSFKSENYFIVSTYTHSHRQTDTHVYIYEYVCVYIYIYIYIHLKEDVKMHFSHIQLNSIFHNSLHSIFVKILYFRSVKFIFLFQGYELLE